MNKKSRITSCNSHQVGEQRSRSWDRGFDGIANGCPPPYTFRSPAASLEFEGRGPSRLVFTAGEPWDILKCADSLSLSRGVRARCGAFNAFATIAGASL